MAEQRAKDETKCIAAFPGSNSKQAYRSEMNTVTQKLLLRLVSVAGSKRIFDSAERP